MLLIYRILINLIFILSPIIIILRIIKKKEDPIRFKEKLGIFSKNRNKGNLIWFHGASVGEIQSIVPIVEKFEKNKNIHQILITSNTLSSSKIVKKLRFKKVIHQFFPIDTNITSKKFIDYWKPSKVFFIDSEIWPNIILNLNKKNIPIVLINGRITKKTFGRWYFFSNFAKEIFSKFQLCLSSNKETYHFLKKLNIKNLKFIGNLKYAQSEDHFFSIEKKLKKFFKTKTIWCASSTHKTEELFCGLAHLKLKKKFKNLLTIIIPRHVERTEEIKNELERINLRIHLHESKGKINKNTDIYLVNSYGKTKSFYKNCKNVFLGGSIINHGGQNPLEAVRYGCSILHGPNVNNFKEIYDFLNRKKISTKINNPNQLIDSLSNSFLSVEKTNNNHIKLKSIGKKILDKTYKEINL